MTKRRIFTPSKNRLRNLKQYASMSDDEFESFYSDTYDTDEISDDSLVENFEDDIKYHVEKLGEDYDLSDMKANDMMQLRALVMAMIQLEFLEKELYKRRTLILR